MREVEHGQYVFNVGLADGIHLGWQFELGLVAALVEPLGWLRPINDVVPGYLSADIDNLVGAVGRVRAAE